jgi:nucleoside 2-deoxyribosyltransferase
MKRIYLAAPLFTAAEIAFNQNLYEFLTSHGYNVFLPQKECVDKKGQDIFDTCKAGLDTCSLVLAIVDGADADSGTCWECGYATAKGIHVIAVRTDFRLSGDTRGFNAMIYYSAKAIVESQKDYLEDILKALKEIK